MKQNKPKKMLMQILFLILLMGITFYIMLHDQDIEMILEAAVDANYCWIFLACCSMILYIFCGGWCIRVLMNGLGHYMSYRKCFKYSFVEFYFSALTPSSTGGQPMQLVYMKKDGYSFSDSSVILLIVTVLYKFSFLMLALVLFLTNLSFMARRIYDMRFLFILGLFMNIALITALCLLLFSKKLIFSLTDFALRLLGKLRIIKNTERILSTLDEKISKYHNCACFLRDHPILVLRTFLILTLQRLAILAIPFFIYRSFGFQVFDLNHIICTQLLVNICVDMMPLPGAVGISESVFLVLFEPIFTELKLYSAVLMSRGISFYMMVLLSGLVICGIQLREILQNKQKKKQKDSAF